MTSRIRRSDLMALAPSLLLAVVLASAARVSGQPSAGSAVAVSLPDTRARSHEGEIATFAALANGTTVV
jgi:hypothetical protein